MLEKNSVNCKKAVLIGGGLIGVEMAEMLRTRKIDVTFLVREKAFWGSVLPYHDAHLISNHIVSHGVDLRHEEELEKILSDENGRVKGIITKNGEQIACELVGLCAGVHPNIGFLKNTSLEVDKGILVDEYLQTNITDVYAIGDCVQQRKNIGERKPIEAVWYTGRMMGETLAQTLTGNKTPYKPGNWFNSAKFFDIEYQTYGWVWSKPKENEQHLNWKHEDETKFLTISFDKTSNKFLGINIYGIRLRHEVIDRWLNEERSIEYVLSHLKEANFDPEFYKTYEKEIFSAFKNQLTTA